MYHMEAGSVRVKEGDTVDAGTPLGTGGATGIVSGQHLHMEFFAGALPNPMVPINPNIDPIPTLKGKGFSDAQATRRHGVGSSNSLSAYADGSR